MANPTESSVQTQIGDAWLAMDELDRKLVRDATDPTTERVDRMIQGLEGDFSSASAAGIEAFRAFCSATVASSVGQSLADGHILDYGKVLALPDGNVFEILERLRRDFQDNAKSVQTRGFVYGPPSAGGGNLGDGTLIRLTEDEAGFDLEGATTEEKVANCIQDSASGATKHQEVFEFGGEDPPKDNLAGFRSPDRLGNLIGINADNAEAYIRNPTFGQPVVVGETDLARVLPGWTLTNAAANVSSDETTFYRDSSQEGGSPKSLEVNADEVLFQTIADNGGAFDANLPYYFHVAFRLKNAALGAGTLTIAIGNASAVFDLSTISDADWHLLQIVADKDSWFRTFNKSALQFSLAIAGIGANPVLLDDITIEQFTLFDGTAYAMVGGAIPFVVDDDFTFTDTANAPETSIIQYGLWRHYGFYLPSSGTPTWLEPIP